VVVVFGVSDYVVVQLVGFWGQMILFALGKKFRANTKAKCNGIYKKPERMHNGIQLRAEAGSHVPLHVKSIYLKLGSAKQNVERSSCSL
jgi:hypothetical protein